MAAKQKRKQKEKNTVTKWETQSGKEERRRRASWYRFLPMKKLWSVLLSPKRRRLHLLSSTLRLLFLKHSNSSKTPNSTPLRLLPPLNPLLPGLVWICEFDFVAFEILIDLWVSFWLYRQVNSSHVTASSSSSTPTPSSSANRNAILVSNRQVRFFFFAFI